MTRPASAEPSLLWRPLRGALGCALWWLAGAAAAGCASHTASPPKPESCNGIDDNGDGRVDEGCPCQPFEISLPFRVNTAVSLGVGWALIANDLTPQQMPDSQASYVRLDDLGVVAAMTPLDGVAWGERRQMVWNGSELAYVLGDLTSAHVAFLTPDGMKTHDGPSIPVPSSLLPLAQPVHGKLAVTPTGYDVVLSAAAASGAPVGFYAPTNRTGVPQIALIQAPGPTGSHVFAIGEIDGDTTVGWTLFDASGSGSATVYAGEPFSTDQPILTAQPMQGLPGEFDDGDGDGNGSTMAFAILNSVIVFDGTTAAQVSLLDALAIAWAGDHLEVAVLKRESDGVGLGEVRFTPDLLIRSPPPIFPDTVKSDPPVGNAPQPHDAAFVSADARRALFGYFYVAGGVGHQALAQVCF